MSGTSDAGGGEAGGRLEHEDRVVGLGHLDGALDAALDVAAEVADDPEPGLGSAWRPQPFHVGAADQARVAAVPVDAVDQNGEMIQVRREPRSVALRVVVVVLEVEGRSGRHRLDQVLLPVGDPVDEVPGRIGVGRHLLHLGGRDLACGQIGQDLLDAVGHVAVSGHPDDQGSELVGKTLGGEPFAREADGRPGSDQAGVGVGAVDPGERAGDPLPPEAVAEDGERVDHPGQPGVAAEEDQPIAALVGEPFVVDQGAAEVEDPSEHGHVVGLTLDDVGEEDVGLVGKQELTGDLLDAEDDLGGGQLFGHGGPGLVEELVAEDPSVRGLHQRSDAVLVAELPNGRGREGSPTLPRPFVLSPDPDQLFRHALLPSGGRDYIPRGRWATPQPPTRPYAIHMRFAERIASKGESTESEGDCGTYPVARRAFEAEVEDYAPQSPHWNVELRTPNVDREVPPALPGGRFNVRSSKFDVGRSSGSPFAAW